MTGVEPNPEKTYWAFISYSSKDRKWGEWLHKRLENYPIPAEFRKIRFLDGALLGKNLRPCFRDRDELAGSAELGPAIEKALRNTRYLIVLCSPNSARSEWVNKEIEDFRAIKGNEHILALILDGVPNATSNPDIADELECFPPALRYPNEPLAGDLRKEGDGKERGFLKIISGVAQLDFDTLYRRHERAQRKRRAVMGTLAIAFMLSLSALSLFAIHQKKEAQRQTVIALEKESEAAHERDQARKTLAKFYSERALATDDAGESLAWLQKACEVDPATLQQPHINQRARQWIDPWPAPDTCLGTGKMEESLYMSGYARSLDSRASKRLVTQTRLRSWNLIDWESKALVGAFDFPEAIDSITNGTGDGDFAVLGAKTLEIRSWLDGSLFYRLADGFRSPRISVTPQAVFLASYRYEEKETRIRRISRNAQDWSASDVATLKGEITSIISSAHDGIERVFVIEEKNGGAPHVLHGFESGTSPAKWKPIRLDVPPDFAPGYFHHHQIPLPDESVLITQSGESPDIIFDLRSLTFAAIPTEDNMIAIARVDGMPKLIVRRYEEDSRDSHAYAISMGDGSESALLEGRAFDNLAFCPLGGAMAGWNNETRMLSYQPLGEETALFALDAPLDWPSMSVGTIQENEENLLTLEAYAYSREVIIAADLTRPAGQVFHFGAAPDFDSCLDLTRSENGLGMVSLSHGGRSVSYHKRLLTTAEWGGKSRTRIMEAPGEIEWLGVDDNGMVSLIITRKVNEERMVSVVSSEGHAADWHPTSFYKGTDSIQPLPSGHKLLTSYGQSQMFTPDGALLWEGDTEQAIAFQSDDSEYLLRKEEGAFILSDLPAKRILFEITSTEDCDDLVHMPETDQVAALSHGFSIGILGDDDSGHFALTTIDLTDGSRETFPLDANQVEIKKMEEYGNTFRIIPGSQPRIIHLAAQGNDTVIGRVLENVNGKLQETIRWTSEEENVSEPCTVLPDGSFLSKVSGDDGTGAHLIHFRNTGGGWDSLQIPLPGSATRIAPNHKGTACVIFLKDNAILYDLLAHRQIGGFLDLREDYASISPADAVEWHPGGGTFFLWDQHSVHQFDASSGRHIRRIKAHNRQDDGASRPEINNLSLSPDGDWLSSSDSTGVVITTRETRAHTSLEELKSKSLHLGGLRVVGDDDLAPWSPPLAIGKAE